MDQKHKTRTQSHSPPKSRLSFEGRRLIVQSYPVLPDFEWSQTTRITRTN